MNIHESHGILLTGILALLLASPMASADEVGEATPTVSEVALQRLKASADFLADQKRFRVRADVAYDVLQANGQLLEFGGTREAWLERPDRLRVEAAGRDGERRTVTFDGTTLAIDLPLDEAYVSIERPGTVYAALDHLVEDLGTPAPLEDLLAENFHAEIAGVVTSGVVVGEDWLGGRRCEHLALRSEGVDAQIWIETGVRPLPCRIVVTYKREPGNPRFRADLSGWDLDPVLGEDLFRHAPQPGSEALSIGKAVAEIRDDAKGGQ